MIAGSRDADASQYFPESCPVPEARHLFFRHRIEHFPRYLLAGRTTLLPSVRGCLFLGGLRVRRKTLRFSSRQSASRTLCILVERAHICHWRDRIRYGVEFLMRVATVR